MEMSAVIAALYYLRKNLPKQKTCAIYSDSNLLIQSIKQGWKKKKNTDLWGKLEKLIAEFDDIQWHWVKGHVGHPENTEADKIAVKEALKQKSRKKGIEHELAPDIEPAQLRLI